MKRSLLSLLVLATLSTHGQTEFATYENGLIYSTATMTKLERIVDSLNLKYKNCEMNKVYYSVPQTVGQLIELDSMDIKQAKKDMDNHISYDDFVKKYPSVKIKKDVLVVKFRFKNYAGKDLVEYGEVNLDGHSGSRINKENVKDIYHQPMAGNWVYEYWEGGQYTSESIKAFYFPQEFTTKIIVNKYARQIGYADCLVDTASTKFKKDLKAGWVDLPANWETLNAAAQKHLLDKMRGTKVVGGCSQDSRPREHAINIAILSAATTNWEVFLKAHLDIMNDRFDRMSDGSYAQAGRKTYIRELEKLDINVTDLLIGISLRVENASDNHYYGSISRLGRAISESANKAEFEQQMLDIIENTQLDDYNRVLGYYLFDSYNYNLESKPEQKKNDERLKKSLQTLPVYLRNKIGV